MDIDVLLGKWVATLSPEGTVVARTHYTFEWIEDGAFMLQAGTTELTDDAPQVWRENAPTSTRAVIGRDDRSGRYGYLYWDSRGVRRVYEMSLEEGLWRIWGRAGEAFFQRFAGTFSDDGQRIDSVWERSGDAETWEIDFEGTYERIG